MAVTNKKAVAEATAAPAAPAAKAEPKKAGASWMKTGKKAQEMANQEEEKVQQQMAEANRMRRFFLPAGADTKITFLDGKLDEDGVLDAPRYFEHNVFMGGKWTNWFVCTKEEEPCPVCEGGNEPKLVAVFTVIDHSEWKSPKTGVVYKDQRKLLVCKRNSFKVLQKKAEKQGGLAGCTFDVARTSDKDASIGNDFDFCEKRTKAQLIEAYPTLKDEMCKADYEKEIPYLTADELRKLGFGSMVVGAEAAAKEEVAATSSYADEL